MTGSVDLSTGEFSASSTGVYGSGALEGVSGHLHFNGKENLASGVFHEGIAGKLCARLP